MNLKTYISLDSWNMLFVADVLRFIFAEEIWDK